jgi:ribosome-binding factor A
MSRQDDKLREAIHELVAKLFNEQSNKSSLITVTRVALTEKARKATVFITVLPEEKEMEALSFGRRLRTEIRGKILEELDIAHPPFIEVEIDFGEKNRVRIEELSRE